MLDITAEDRLAIHDVIALHGHVADDRDWDRLGDLFTDDAILDLEDFGYGTLHGLQAIKDLSRGNQDDKSQPLGHHATNIIIVGQDGEGVRARSKALAVAADGTTGTAVYEDIFRRGAHGWRISRRKVIARKAPDRADETLNVVGGGVGGVGAAVGEGPFDGAGLGLFDAPAWCLLGAVVASAFGAEVALAGCPVGVGHGVV
jgi:SnoaL-like domain